MQASKAIQDYLKIIYSLTERGEDAATTSAIADLLGVQPASVTGMVQKLARHEPPLVHYEKHRGVTLTPDGLQIALQVIRRHRLLETLLHETLDYEWDEVHEEADRLEHAVTNTMTRRIARMLGHPRHDPHGQPIPTHHLELPELADCPLDEVPVGTTAVIRRVADEDPTLLQTLARHNLRPGTTFRLVASDEQHLTLKVSGQETLCLLPRHDAPQILVEVISTT